MPNRNGRNGNHNILCANIDGIAETQESLGFCAKHNITADIERIIVDQVNEAFERLEKGDVKFSFVLDIA